MTSLAASTLLGGIGLFLLGMNLMTESLTALGGGTLRSLLRTLTRKRLYGLLFGAGVTATLQSSSATTLITVGFVSAGLLTFHQSLGVIFGANLGTTSTAWIVSLIGLKVKVSTVALPLVGVGALVRLFTRGRRARLGFALAGFGLVFVGIDVMQEGMSGMQLDLRIDTGGIGGLLAMVGIGAVMTIVMQSSSAAVATTLVALDAGTIGFHQAAALVIGQNVGTTVTAILGALGGTVAARRAALAHTLFNLGTGLVALAVLGPFLSLVEAVGEQMQDASPETGIAIFHTAFNLLGVALFFPLAPRFALLVERLMPSRDIEAVRRLAPSALQVPAVALEAARRSIAEVGADALALAVDALRWAGSPRPGTAPLRKALELIKDPRRLLEDPRALFEGTSSAEREILDRLKGGTAAVDAIATYLGRIRTTHEPTGVRDEHVELLHGIDHVRRLLRAVESTEVLDAIESDEMLRRQAMAVVRDVDPILTRLGTVAASEQWDEIASDLQRATDSEAERREAYRHVLLARIADGDLDPIEGETKLKASRWIAKTPKHAHRVFRHLAWTTGTPRQELEDED